MKKISGFIVLALFISLSVNTWAAEKMKEATVEYSADMVMEAAQVATTGKIFHALGGKDRMEMTAQGMTSVIITRMDKKIAWMLMPAQNMYMEMSLEESAKKTGGANVSDCDMDFSSQGDETVNGVKATKNKISASCPDNTKYDGTMWITKDNIVVKMDAVTEVDGKKTQVKMDLNNLNIGKQDASLFEVPEGYQKFSMGNITSMFKSAQQEAAKAQEQEAKEQAARDAEEKSSSSEVGMDGTPSASAVSSESGDEASGESDNKVKGTINKLKGIFGR